MSLGRAASDQDVPQENSGPSSMKNILVSHLLVTFCPPASGAHGASEPGKAAKSFAVQQTGKEQRVSKRDTLPNLGLGISTQ